MDYFRAGKNAPGETSMQRTEQIEKDLHFLGLLEKARELCAEMGEGAALSYLRSSYKLLSKVYHPDLNPSNADKAKRVQQRLNRVHDLMERLTDEQLGYIFKKGRPQGQLADKKKILVVEDEFGLQEMFGDIFRMEGYDVKVAVDGDQGYEAFLRFRPDLVFTDVVMPKMTGLELVRKIRKSDPAVKVIYMSGFFGIKNLKRDLDEDISRYGYPTLAKPFKVSTMLNLVKEYLP